MSEPHIVPTRDLEINDCLRALSKAVLSMSTVMLGIPNLGEAQKDIANKAWHLGCKADLLVDSLRKPYE